MKASELIEHLKSYIDITGGDCEMLYLIKLRVFLVVLRILLRMVIMCFCTFRLIDTQRKHQSKSSMTGKVDCLG